MIALVGAMLAIYALLRRANCDTLLVRAWTLVWVLSGAGALVLDERAWWELSPLVPVLCGVTVALGAGSALVGGRAAVVPTKDVWEPVLGAGWHVLLLGGCVAISLVSVALLLRDLGLDLGVFAAPEELVAAAAAAAIARYQDDFNPEPLTRILLVFVFLSGLLTGWYVARPVALWRRLVVGLFAFLPPLMWTALLTTKANVLIWLCFMVSSWRVFGVSDRCRRRGGPVWLLAAAGVLSLAGLLFAVQVSRYGGDLQQVGQDATDALVGAAVGHVFALRDWLERGIRWWPEDLGARTFAGVAELLGVMARQAGLYADDQVAVGSSETNVFTALRPLMEDFGALLVFCGCLVAGIVATWLERRASGRAVPSALLAIALSALLWSPITSLFAYNSLIVSCVLFITVAASLRRSPAACRSSNLPRFGAGSKGSGEGPIL